MLISVNIYGKTLASARIRTVSIPSNWQIRSSKNDESNKLRSVCIFRVVK